MRVVNEYPPMIDEIDAAFNVRGKTIIFAWGDIIYSPTGWNPPPSLIAHEEVHGRRQGNDIEGWWKQYINDPIFRLEEEVLAHIEEYRYIVQASNRSTRRRALKQIATRLSSPLYGKIISIKEAKEILLRGVKKNNA